jgi:hypothetical protein
MITRWALTVIIALTLSSQTSWAYDNAYLDPFTTTNWNTSGGWQSCAAYSGGRPCISNGSYFSGNGISAGDVVFAYTTNNISDTFGITSTMRSSTGSNYVAIDMMTGPRNSEQGNKTEYVGITIIKYSSVGSQIQSYSFSENITNTSMETFAYDIGSLANTYNIGIIISGRDGGYWAGNYGAVIGSGSLYVTDTDPTAPAAPTYTSAPTAAQTALRNTLRALTHDGNGIYIDQVGDDLDLDIVQDGDNNLIAGTGTTSTTIAKAEIAGDGNTIALEQKSDSNVLLFDVDGNYNNLTVSQGNDLADGGSNVATIGINGAYNDVSLTQKNSGFENGQFASISITGNDNYVASQQQDSDQMLFIDITGSDSSLTTNQKGTGNHFLDISLGSDQTLSVTQEGSGNHAATIALDGYSSSLQLNQNSSSNQTYSIDQTCANANGCGTTVVTQN